MKNTIYGKIIEILRLKQIPLDQFLRDLNITEEKFIAWSEGMPLTDQEIKEISDYLGVTFDYFFMDIASNAKKKQSGLSVMDKISEMNKEAEKAIKKEEESNKIYDATKEKKTNKFKIASIVITTIIALVMVGGFAYICSTAIEITGDHPEVIGYLVLFGAIFAACLIVAFVQLFKRNR